MEWTSDGNGCKSCGTSPTESRFSGFVNEGTSNYNQKELMKDMQRQWQQTSEILYGTYWSGDDYRMTVVESLESRFHADYSRIWLSGNGLSGILL
jgi:hypothetical protein